MKTKFLIITYFVLSLINNSFATENYKFRTMSPPGGFTYDGIIAIQQDTDGFIWILSEEELYRYDGYSYKRHSSYLKKINSKCQWYFNSMDVDKKGNLFVNTNNGLFQYNRISDQFILLTDSISSKIFVDEQNNLWRKEKSNWSKFNIELKKDFFPKFDGESPHFISNIHCTHNKDLYLFSYLGRIYRYNYTKDEFNLCSILPKQKRILGAKAFKAKLWVITEDSTLFKIDLASFNIEEQYKIEEDLTNFTQHAFYIEESENIWLGTINGLYIFNPKTGKTKHFVHSESNQFSIPNNSIWTINEDNQKNIWIGTYSGAMSYINLSEKNPFENYLPQNKKLSHAPVSSFAEDNDNIWIGTEGGGINRMNKKTSEFTYYTQNCIDNKLSSNNIKSLVIDKSNKLWIGTYTGGIDCINLTTGKVKNYHSGNDNTNLISNNIRKIVLESDSGIWITYQLKKFTLSFYSFKNKTFSHYDFSEQFQDAYIFDILRTRENQLWILTKKKIYLMNVHEKSIKEIKHDHTNFMNFSTFCMDVSGNLWIGTIGNGLIKYNPSDNKFSIEKEILKHHISAIYNICFDENNRLWIGTDNGLTSYNTRKKEIYNYNNNDGLKGSVYYPLATMKSKDAKLYFGTTNGFTILDPRKISINSHVPKVIISEFFINYKPTKLNIQHKPQTDEITLKYNENNFGFKFSSDNFLIPEKTKFKYRLKGYDEDWIQVTSHNRTANYSKVPAGVYYFEVLATNNDGIWSNKPTRLKVIQYPAPWFSTPAYILYFIISIILIFYIIRYFKTKKELKLQLYLENIEKQKKDEINQSQLRFFTNISHDFKTPLSLIIASLDSLRKEGLKEYYYNILNNNAKRLLNLVNELMDFRAIEYGKIKLEVEPLNFNKFITNISADFNDLARQKNISYDISCDSEMPQKLYFDKNIIEKVVMNLLHNAFKYTKANGQISIKTHTKVLKSKFSNNYVVESDYKTENCFYLTVSDSGVGISKDSIKTIFERFYKVSSNNLDSHLGTGIGLGLVKSLVMLHRGTITVSSERTKGTSITVGFSFDKDIYDKENIIEKNDVEDYDEEIDDEINEMSTPRIPQKNKKKILFAEDNEELRTLISDYLSSDFDIIQAEDGMIAKKILSTKYIDLVISDIMMPGMDGITLSKNIKSNIETSHIPLMLLTAKSGTESKIEGADSGADYYFEKPISPELLKKTIENIFKQQQQLREYYAKNNFANNAEFTSNDRDAEFIRDFIEVININIKDSNTNINNIATAMSMSRSKLYRKIKTMTGMSIIEFILNYKLKKAAKLIIEEDITMREVMDIIGIESQAYFTNAFKKEFGETPTAFAARHKKQT